MDPDPDQLVRSKDPRIRIRTKMSRIPNTVYTVLHFEPSGLHFKSQRPSTALVLASTALNEYLLV
jgi:hypothetical protein